MAPFTQKHLEKVRCVNQREIVEAYTFFLSIISLYQVRTNQTLGILQVVNDIEMVLILHMNGRR